MSSFTHRLAALGLLALPVVVGCVGEETDQRGNFPRAPGSDDPMEASQGGVPEALPTQESAMEGMPDPQMQGAAPEEPPEDGYADTDPSALTDFRSTLDPHGQWIEDPNYGTMWQPSQAEVGSDFAPYVSGGHWGYDDDSDYVWVSDYGWGWAPYHYGRWAYGSTGWGWVPGRTYAPSWVTWRTGYPGFGYVGWAPLPPAYYWGRGGMAYGFTGAMTAPYAFCSTNSLFAPTGLSGRVVTAPGAVQTIAGQTHPYSPPAGSGGRVAANPTVAGPTPQSLHIPSNQVNHVASSNPQLSRAQQFSHASTAMALGAHGPAVGGKLGALGSQNVASRGNGMPGGAVAGHPQISSRGMPSYGGASHSYYNNRTSTQLGSSYGHGGSMRSYGTPSATHLSGTHSSPAYVPPVDSSGSHPTTGTTTSSGHFGGHYGGGGGHGGGGGRR
jgi:hypothetical protein